jgi:hypothetical protein
MLNPAVKQSIDVFARGTIASFEADESAAPSPETASFLSSLRNTDPHSIGRLLYPRDIKVDISCDADARTVLDSTLSSSNADVFSSDAAWAASTAPSETEPRASSLSALLRLAAYRAHTPECPCGQEKEKDEEGRKQEFRSFAEAALLFFERASDRKKFSNRMRRELTGPRDGWCALHAAFVGALADGPDGDRASEAELWRILFSFDRKEQGDIASTRQVLAGLALSFVAVDHDLNKERITQLAQTIETSGSGFDVDLPQQNLLQDVGRLRGYPTPVQSLLESKIRKGESDFEDIVAAQLLACAGRSRDPAIGARLHEWMRMNTQNNRTMSIFADALGCISSSYPLEDDQLLILLDKLSPASRFPPPAVTDRGETIISSNGDRAAVALGRYAQTYALPEGRVDLLAEIAASRADLQGRREIVRGLAARWYGAEAALAYAMARRISGAVSDARRRSLEIEVAAERVATLSSADRERTRAELADRWRNEPEPEMRIALAKLLGMIATQ